MNKKPLSLDEIEKNLPNIFPDYVIEAINQVLMEHYRGTGKVDIKQSEFENRIIKLSNGKLDIKTLYAKKYLDFENLYSQYGWKVGYDKPGYNESGSAYYTFSKR